MKSKSQVFVTVAAYVLGILSLVAGAPKLLQMPQDLAFLSSIAVAGSAVSALGAAQLVGGLLLFPGKTRLIGAGMTAVVFGISSAALLIGGDVTLGLVSLLPVAAALALGYRLLDERRRGGTP
jgi:hypothetical protein